MAKAVEADVALARATLQDIGTGNTFHGSTIQFHVCIFGIGFESLFDFVSDFARAGPHAKARKDLK